MFPEGEASRRLYFVSAFLLIILIGGIDYLTGPVLTVLFLYLLPVSLVAWKVGFREGLVTALISSVVDFLADLTNSPDVRILVWNTFVRFLIFCGFCLLLARRRQIETKLRESENRLVQLMEALPVGIFVVDANGKPFYSNQAANELLGRKAMPEIPQDQLASTYEAYALNSNELYPTEKLPVVRALHGERCVVDDIEIHRRERVIPLQVQAAPIYAGTGSIQFAVAAFTDVTEDRKAQQEIREAKARLEEWIKVLEERNQEMALLSEVGDLLQSSLTQEEAYKIASTYVEKAFSGSAGALYLMRNSRNILEQKAIWGDFHSEPFFLPTDCWALRKGRNFFSTAEDRIVCAHTNLPVTGESSCIPMYASGQVVGLLHVNLREGSLRNKEQRLRTLAETISLTLSNLTLRETLRNEAIRDPLTGVFNRRYFEETIDHEFSRARRKNRPLSLIMFDLDHFKRFNDQYGHPAGDELLKAFGNLLIARIRSDDIACRYGGEEFVVILPECSLEDARNVAEKIREHTKTLNLLAETASVSAGLSSYPGAGDTWQTLIAEADRALYQAKNSGRDRVVSFVSGHSTAT